MAREPLSPLSQPVFSEPAPTPDPSSPGIPVMDQKEYSAVGDLLKKEVVGFEPSNLPDDGLYSLQAAWGQRGADVVKTVVAARKIVFHALGDSGAASARTFASEVRVADAMTTELHSAAEGDRPCFLFHLGDLVYNFGEPAYYYDQFYDPFRDYAAPIFAIPGNHDSFVVPGTPPDKLPLAVFQRNFCSAARVVTAEAGSLHRTAMTQPGVYFTLDAPFLRIIGLFSNALEDPGVISSQGGKWPDVPDSQLAFLTAQLRKIRTEGYKGAVIIAVHHPPFSYATNGPEVSARHGGSPAMLAEIDRICAAEKVYPHAFLSGHAHNYQRYTRTLLFEGQTMTVPFIVCGDGGHNVNPLVHARNGVSAAEPADGMDVSYMEMPQGVQSKGLVLERHDQKNFGYLRVEVDAGQLSIAFVPVTPQRAAGDTVTVDLASHTVTRGASRRAGPAAGAAARAAGAGARKAPMGTARAKTPAARKKPRR